MSSKVLVIHPDDRSTDVLKIVYEGKGYDVITNYNTSDKEIREAIANHDKIILLGHGTPNGLLCGEDTWYGFCRFARYIIGDEHADLLKEKETYSMWCNSDEYFRKHGMKGFHSGMIISERGEAEYYGIYGMSDEEIERGLVPLMEAMKDSIEMNADDNMRNLILERYNSKDPVTERNRQNIIIL